MRTDREIFEQALAALETFQGVTANTVIIRKAIEALRARLNEHPPAGFKDWWESDGRGWYGMEIGAAAWAAAQQAERERIRARAKLAAEKTWKAGDWYIGPQHYMVEQFVDVLLEDGDNKAAQKLLIEQVLQRHSGVTHETGNSSTEIR